MQNLRYCKKKKEMKFILTVAQWKFFVNTFDNYLSHYMQELQQTARKKKNKKKD